MKHGSRTIKMLACLVVSMTGTSAVLSWLDPSLPPSQHALPSETIVALAREVVSQDVVVESGKWHEIEVVRMAGSRGAQLAAVADPGDWHFRIDEDGRPEASPRWRVQQAAGDRPNVVRIGLVTPGPVEITSSQAIAVRALVAHLETLTGGIPAVVSIPMLAGFQG